MIRIFRYCLFSFIIYFISCSAITKIDGYARKGEIGEICEYGNDDDISIKKFALRKLGTFKESKSAAECLLKNLNKANPVISKIILEGLGNRTSHQNYIFEKLVDFLNTPELFNIPQIVEFLIVERDSPTSRFKNQLQYLLNNNNIDISLSATLALLKFNEPINKNVIEKGLVSNFILTRRKAAKLIEMLSNDQDKLYLLSFILDDTDREIKGICKRMTQRLGRLNSPIDKKLYTVSLKRNKQLILDGKCSSAVYNFKSAGVSDIITKILTDKIRNGLVNLNTCKIIEKETMNEILNEQSFQLSGCTDDACIIEVGRIIGVKYIITGTFGKVNNMYTLIIRTIDVETAEILKSNDYNWTTDINDIITNKYLIAINSVF